MVFVLGALLQGSLPLAMGGVFLMGVHSAVFGPSKYGLLPELLPAKDLSWGNGIIEMMTFVAIIAGTAAAGVLHQAFAGRSLGRRLALAGRFVTSPASHGSPRPIPASLRVNVLETLDQMRWPGATASWPSPSLQRLAIASPLAVTVIYGTETLHAGRLTGVLPRSGSGSARAASRPAIFGGRSSTGCALGFWE